MQHGTILEIIYIPVYRLLSVDTIVDRIYAVQEYPTLHESAKEEDMGKNWSKLVIVPTPRHAWASAFSQITTNYELNS